MYGCGDGGEWWKWNMVMEGCGWRCLCRRFGLPAWALDGVWVDAVGHVPEEKAESTPLALSRSVDPSTPLHPFHSNNRRW